MIRTVQQCVLRVHVVSLVSDYWFLFYWISGTKVEKDGTMYERNKEVSFIQTNKKLFYLVYLRKRADVSFQCDQFRLIIYITALFKSE